MPGSVQEILRAWARSSNINDPYVLGFPHAAPFERMMPKGEYFEAPPPPLDDDMHIVVDRAVCELKARNRQKWLVIMGSYRQNLRDHQIASWMRMSRKSVTDLRISGENQIDAWLFEKSANL